MPAILLTLLLALILWGAGWAILWLGGSCPRCYSTDKAISYRPECSDPWHGGIQ